MSFHSGLGIPVAVKILKPHLIEEDPEFLDRFIQEGRLAVSLHHKNIVRVFDAGKAGESYYLVMELLEGNDVLHFIQHDGAFSVDRVLEIGCAVTDALIDAHEHGVIHRDIKPDNIMITSEGKIKLADLGLAKKLGDEFSSTMVGTTIGTPNYMSPEQAMNSSEADIRSDIYSLGATLYHMITGTLPFKGESIMAVMMKHANEPLEHPQSRKEGLPNNICSVIIKMMEKDPEKRYQNCDEVLTALNKIRYAPTESEKPKTNVLKTKTFKKPTKILNELKAQKKEKKILDKKPRKLSPVLIAIIVLVIIIPVLLLSFGKSKESEPSQKTDDTLNNSVNNVKKVVEDKVPLPTPEQLKPDNTIEKINLLADCKIPEIFLEKASIQKGLLRVKPRNQFFYMHLKGVHRNCKITMEYKLARPKSYAKIALLKNPLQSTNVIISSFDHPKQSTGTIQLQNGTGPDFKYINAFKAENRVHKDHSEWNKLQIIIDGKTMTVSVNGTQVSSFTGEYEEGSIAILAEKRTHLVIKNFVMTSLK